MFGEIEELRTGIETARRRHHIGRTATDETFLPTRHSALVDRRTPADQPDETQGCGFEPLDQALDSGQAIDELGRGKLIGATRGAFHEVGHADAVIPEEGRGVSVTVGQPCREHRWPEPVARSSEGDAVVGRCGGGVESANE